MIRFWNNFTKITAWPVQKLIFRTRIYYEDRSVQGRRIKGPAIVVCNHTSVFDYAVLLFVFFTRTVRFQMAELLFEKKHLGRLLRLLGGIRVDRNSHDFSFVIKSEHIINRGGAVGVFPESRLPLENEERPLPFKPSVAYLALATNAPVIPVYTNGVYFKRGRARVIIGTPFYANDYVDDSLTDKENINLVAEKMRDRIIELGEELKENEAK